MTSQTQSAKISTQAPRFEARDIHEMLYCDIGIAALAAVLKVNDEWSASAHRKPIVHPLPVILQELDLAA